MDSIDNRIVGIFCGRSLCGGLASGRNADPPSSDVECGTSCFPNLKQNSQMIDVNVRVLEQLDRQPST